MQPNLNINPKRKGFANVVWMVVFAVIAFAVLGLIVTYTTDIIEQEHIDICPSGDTFITNTSVPSGNSGTNPVTGSWYGCCQTVTVGNNCTAWRTDNYAVNASFAAIEAQSNIAERQETMSNVIMAGAIIMILMAAFGGFAMYSKK